MRSDKKVLAPDITIFGSKADFIVISFPCESLTCSSQSLTSKIVKSALLPMAQVEAFLSARKFRGLQVTALTHSSRDSPAA